MRPVLHAAELGAPAHETPTIIRFVAAGPLLPYALQIDFDRAEPLLVTLDDPVGHHHWSLVTDISAGHGRLDCGAQLLGNKGKLGAHQRTAIDGIARTTGVSFCAEASSTPAAEAAAIIKIAMIFILNLPNLTAWSKIS